MEEGFIVLPVVTRCEDTLLRLYFFCSLTPLNERKQNIWKYQNKETGATLRHSCLDLALLKIHWK